MGIGDYHDAELNVVLLCGCSATLPDVETTVSVRPPPVGKLVGDIDELFVHNLMLVITTFCSYCCSINQVFIITGPQPTVADSRISARGSFVGFVHVCDENCTR